MLKVPGQGRSLDALLKSRSWPPGPRAEAEKDATSEH